MTILRQIGRLCFGLRTDQISFSGTSSNLGFARRDGYAVVANLDFVGLESGKLPLLKCKKIATVCPFDAHGILSYIFA